MAHPFRPLIAVLALSGVAAWAETEAEYRMDVPAAAPAVPSMRVAPRVPLYAPEAAKTAARMSPELRAERGFIKSAAAATRFEAEASKLALAKSRDPRVRSLASALVERHEATRLEFTHLLHVRGMALPMLDNGQVKVLKALGKMQGGKFDRFYLEEVGLKSQREGLAQYERAQAQTTDPSLRHWLDRELPLLRQHLAVAERTGSADTTRGTAMGAGPIRRVSVSGSP